MNFRKQLLATLAVLVVSQAIAAAAPQPRFIGAEGKILPADGFIRLAAPWGGSPVVDELHVERGAKVEAGQLLAVFNDRGMRQQELELTKAEVAAAEAAVQQIEAAAARQRAELEAEMERLAGLNADLTWVVDENSPPRRERIEVEMEQRSIGHERQKLRALIAATEATFQSDLAAAKARVEVARRQVVVAETRLDATELKSPMAGTVLQIFARRGESAAEGLLLMVSNAPPRVVAEVFVSELPFLKSGLAVAVTGDGISGPLRGTVAEISPRIGRNILVETDPLAVVDRRVVQVWIDLEDPEPARALLGAQVKVRISRQ